MAHKKSVGVKKIMKEEIESYKIFNHKISNKDQRNIEHVRKQKF